MGGVSQSVVPGAPTWESAESLLQILGFQTPPKTTGGGPRHWYKSFLSPSDAYIKIFGNS